MGAIQITFRHKSLFDISVCHNIGHTISWYFILSAVSGPSDVTISEEPILLLTADNLFMNNSLIFILVTVLQESSQPL